MLVLLLFQNAYCDRSGRFTRPVYSTSWINRKNATYSRVIPYLEPVARLRLAECTPMIATDPTTKFPTDLDWVRRAVDYRHWDHIVSFGVQADQALVDLDVEHISLPHPIARTWRRSDIMNLAKEIRR